MDLTGKKIVFLGDSITQGVGASAPETCYVSRFRAAHPEAEVVNCGISATRFAVQHREVADDSVNNNRFTVRALSLPENADLVVVFGGTNDYGHGNAPLGQMGDQTEETFYGATYVLFDRLIRRYPQAEILVLTPLHRLGDHFPNGQGAVLEDYVKAERKMAELFALPVLDLFANSGINPNLGDLQTVYMPDGLHPNDAGHARLCTRIDAFIRNFY